MVALKGRKVNARTFFDKYAKRKRSLALLKELRILRNYMRDL